MTLCLPNDPLFCDLLASAQETASLGVIVDDVLGFQKSYSHLFGDIQRMSQSLLSHSPPSAINTQGTLFAEIQNVAILTRSAYEFIVAFFAVRAIGGVPMPIASGIFPQEAGYLFTLAKATRLLVGRDRMEKGEEIRVTVKGEDGGLTVLQIACDSPPINMANVEIEQSICLDPDEPGLILFTSGTTGRPKGVVLRRRVFSGLPMAKPGITILNYRPTHWLGGAGVIISAIVTGKRLYSLGERAGASDVLDAVRKYGINHGLFSPQILRSMRTVIEGQSVEDQAQWRHLFKAMGTIKSGAGVLEPSAVKFWTEMSGAPFENRYTATEFGGPVILGTSRTNGSIGKAVPGVEVKLSEGSHGEICVKSPNMFLRYLDNEELTRSVFDDDGYYKTGDMAELYGDEYVFKGRANTDYIMNGIQKISIIDVENCLLDLPYIAEACVVGVADYAKIQLCGAAIRLKKDIEHPVTLAQIRSDLAPSLVPYMMPTLLRILGPGEELSHNASSKVLRKEVVKEYFGKVGVADTISTRVEQYAPARYQIEGAAMWHASGLQRA